MSSNLDESVIRTLRAELLAARQSVVSGLGVAEDDLAAMLEVAEPELEERSQEEAVSDVATRVAGLRFDELRAIQGALTRIANGTYGVCVRCGSGIALERLRAVPSAAICGDCASRAATPDVGGPAREHGPSASLPEELLGLSDAEIAALVREKLRDEVGEAMGSLRVLCRHGLIGLDGEVASDELRQVVLRVIEEEMGLETLDRMGVSRFAREPRAGGVGAGVAALRDSGAAGSDQFEAAEEGTDYVAPDTPPAKVE